MISPERSRSLARSPRRLAGC